MTLESWAYVAEIVGAVAVVASLIYVGVQIRDSNRVNKANARHNLSEFILQVSLFNAAHADRLAAIQQKVNGGGALAAGEEQFQWWSHMSVMLHAETYHYHHELGLMPHGHWKGYVRYMEGYSSAPGFADFWGEVGTAFSRDFCNWMTGLVNRNNGLDLPFHNDV